MRFLTTAPLWMSGPLLVGGGTLLAVLATILVRHRVTLQRLATNNEVAGFKFATVGVLYAVLLGFAVIVVWEKFSDAEATVMDEASAAATIYRLDNGLRGQPAAALRASLTAYLHAAIEQDWPAMERGGDSPAVDRALNAVYAALLTVEPADRRGETLLAEVLRQADLMTQSRRARVIMAAGIVPGVVWLVLTGGAVLTIGFTLFFGTPNLRAQTLMTAMLSLLILGGLLVIVAIDHPFAGTVKVTPEPLEAVLNDFVTAPAMP